MVRLNLGRAVAMWADTLAELEGRGLTHDEAVAAAEGLEIVAGAYDAGLITSQACADIMLEMSDQIWRAGQAAAEARRRAREK